MAVGTLDGYVQLLDLHSGVVHREMLVHNCAVKCLQWSSVEQLVSCGYSQTLSTSAIVRNELYVTDVANGRVTPLRPEDDESPITIIRCSHYHRCTFILTFSRPYSSIMKVIAAATWRWRSRRSRSRSGRCRRAASCAA